MTFEHGRCATWCAKLVLSAAATWAGLAQAGPGASGLPQRNLLVEWRLTGQDQVQGREQGVRAGQVIIDSRGGVIGRASVGLGTVQTERRQSTLQQVQVLNGGRARLYVGRTQPYTVWQWAMPVGAAGGSLGQVGQAGPAMQGGQAGPAAPQVWAQTVWLDMGQGLSVRPSWPGGQAPVVLELQAQSRQPLQPGAAYGGQLDPDGQSRHMEVGSTLSLPLGQWAVVARSGGRTQSQQAGTLSTRDLDEQQTEQLEIRITAP